MLNVIAVMGRLVANPQLRKTPNGVSTTTFTIACERNFVKTGAERETDFFDVVCWRGAAEFVCKYFIKGQLVAVNGSLQTRSYEDKQGNKRKVYEIVADSVNFAESRKTERRDTIDASEVRQDEAQLNIDPDGFAVIDDSEDLPF